MLDLPRIGPMVRDHRAGLGMPRRAKAMAVSMIAVALSVTVGIDTWPTRLVVLTLGAVGVVYVAARVPTRERVLEKRAHSRAGEVRHPSPATARRGAAHRSGPPSTAGSSTPITGKPSPGDPGAP